MLATAVRPEKREFVQVKGAPPFLSTDKKLFDYQLDGLNWMLYAWYFTSCTHPPATL